MKGLSVSKGIAIGKAYYLKPFTWPEKKATDNVEEALERLAGVIIEAVDDLRMLYQKKREADQIEQAEIFEAHRMILEDEEYTQCIEELVRENHYTLDYGIKCATDTFVGIFEAMDNPYFRERAHDMKDVGKRLIRHVDGEQEIALEDLEKGTIILAKDLLPSETARLDPHKVIGFVTEEGGKTSHTAIIANMIGIPAISGIDVESLWQTSNDNAPINLIVDGLEGEIISNPSGALIDIYQKRLDDLNDEKHKLESYRFEEAITKDGHLVKVTANILLPEHGQIAFDTGADGIGLYRSEFLYMNCSEAPSEEVQFEAYKQVVEAMQGKDVIIRTLDVGGDKEIEFLDIGKEMNPFLGYRAIRYCLDHVDIFKIQIRAILRASAFGSIKIMFPMISTLEELRAAKALVHECASELEVEQIDYDENIDIGIMIEVPSAALISDLLAKECDFFSIGTNDLIQYTTAVDRTNKNVEKLYNSHHLGVLRLINMVIKNGHNECIEVGMCGGSAADPTLIPLLCGMGLDKFSVNPPDVLATKALLSSLSYEEESKESKNKL